MKISTFSFLLVVLPLAYAQNSSDYVMGLLPTDDASFINMSVIEKSSALSSACANLDGVNTVPDSGFNNSPFPVVNEVIDHILEEQPNCKATANQYSDQYFMNLTGLGPSLENIYNSISLGEVTTSEKLDFLFDTLGDINVLTPEQAYCVQDYESLVDLLGTENEDLYYGAYNTNHSIKQFSPSYQDQCDREMASAGAWYNEELNEVQSVCNPDSPGLNYNVFATNGTFTRLYQHCGYTFPKSYPDYWSMLTQGIGCYASLTAKGCQVFTAQSGGNHAACYVTIGEATGLRCPMYGPIFYMNVRVVGIIGGKELIARMPGRRVTCHKNDQQSSNCNNMCDVTQIEDFPSCRNRRDERHYPILFSHLKQEEEERDINANISINDAGDDSNDDEGSSGMNSIFSRAFPFAIVISLTAASSLMLL